VIKTRNRCALMDFDLADMDFVLADMVFDSVLDRKCEKTVIKAIMIGPRVSPGTQSIVD
jgi:hypothetical protein